MNAIIELLVKIYMHRLDFLKKISNSVEFGSFCVGITNYIIHFGSVVFI